MAENKNLTLVDDEKLTLEMKTFQMVGVDDYNALLNRPKINGIEVSGEKMLDDYDIKKKSEANAEHAKINIAFGKEIEERKEADSTLENLINAETNRAEKAEKANSDVITAHIADNNNPHGVTAEQINALSLIPAKEISANEDLNDAKYTHVGVYICKMDSAAQTIKNKPTEVKNAFVLTVYRTIDEWYIQEVQVYHSGVTFYRTICMTESDKITVYREWASIYSSTNKPSLGDIGLTAITNSEIDTIFDS